MQDIGDVVNTEPITIIEAGHMEVSHTKIQLDIGKFEAARNSSTLYVSGNTVIEFRDNTLAHCTSTAPFPATKYEYLMSHIDSEKGLSEMVHSFQSFRRSISLLETDHSNMIKRQLSGFGRDRLGQKAFADWFIKRELGGTFTDYYYRYSTISSLPDEELLEFVNISGLSGDGLLALIKKLDFDGGKDLRQMILKWLKFREEDFEEVILQLNSIPQERRKQASNARNFRRFKESGSSDYSEWLEMDDSGFEDLSSYRKWLEMKEHFNLVANEIQRKAQNGQQVLQVISANHIIRKPIDTMNPFLVLLRNYVDQPKVIYNELVERGWTVEKLDMANKMCAYDIENKIWTMELQSVAFCEELLKLDEALLQPRYSGLFAEHFNEYGALEFDPYESPKELELARHIDRSTTDAMTIESLIKEFGPDKLPGPPMVTAEQVDAVLQKPIFENP